MTNELEAILAFNNYTAAVKYERGKLYRRLRKLGYDKFAENGDLVIAITENLTVKACRGEFEVTRNK
jgi:hypothetical protein